MDVSGCSQHSVLGWWGDSRICNLARADYDLVRSIVARDTWDELHFLDERGAREDDGLLDVGGVCDADADHCAADVLDCVGHEFGNEDVVVGAVADGATDDSDRESEGADGGDEVVGANDCGYDGRWDDDAARAKTAQDKEEPEGVHVVAGGAGQRPTTCMCVSKCWGKGVSDQRIPAVISTEATIINSLFLPRNTLSNHNVTQAPTKIASPPGRTRSPTWTGSCP